MTNLAFSISPEIFRSEHSDRNNVPTIPSQQLPCVGEQV